jgi:hypothetical protein
MTTSVSDVKPGELISSDLMNYVLGKLIEFDGRISTLEAGGTKGSVVTINSFDPPNQVAAGQVLSVFGTNFAFPPSNNAVTLDDVSVTAFRPDSTGSLLKFVVPTSLNIPTGGKNVKITVTNTQGTTNVLYRILPAVPVTGPDPVITNVADASNNPFIRIGFPVRITGQNFAADPTQDIITFQITTASGTVVYPKPGQTLVIDKTNSNATQIVVTVPDIAEIQQSNVPTPVTLQVGVGAHVPAATNISIIRP